MEQTYLTTLISLAFNISLLQFFLVQNFQAYSNTLKIFLDLFDSVLSLLESFAELNVPKHESFLQLKKWVSFVSDKVVELILNFHS
ncbi:hypothetical protein RJT34_28045 [Clitoria ternatea]|uniref:Uncharacterized protein n=1 Tax=Clitoria ternatea TaxID=43366 RepID=A0AAN9FD92_CLITE